MRTTLGILTGLAAGGAVAVVLGSIEMLVLHEFRGIIAGILATCGLGIAVGWSTGWGARLWHLRAAPVVLMLGVLTGIIAEFATFWVLAHLLEFAEEGRTVPVFVPLGELSPTEAGDVLKRAVEQGAWHWTRHWHFRGIGLLLVWIVEAASILGLSAAFALLAVRARPYCEACRTWCRGPWRPGPLGLEHEPGDDEELAETLRRLVSDPGDGVPSFLVDLWECRCPDRAVVSVHRVVPGSDPVPIVERTPLPRDVYDHLIMRDHRPLVAAQPIPTGLARLGAIPQARVPDQDSRWVRPCSACGKKLATSAWEHLNGFAVTCPHCGGTHSHPGEMVFLLAITAFTGPLAFFLSMRPVRALIAAGIVSAIFVAGRRWFAGHPSFGLEVAFYVSLLLGCVIFNAVAYARQHSGRI